MKNTLQTLIKNNRKLSTGYKLKRDSLSPVINFFENQISLNKFSKVCFVSYDEGGEWLFPLFDEHVRV
jgi:hypothetical protein